MWVNLQLSLVNSRFVFGRSVTLSRSHEMYTVGVHNNELQALIDFQLIIRLVSLKMLQEENAVLFILRVTGLLQTYLREIMQWQISSRGLHVPPLPPLPIDQHVLDFVSFFRNLLQNCMSVLLIQEESWIRHIIHFATQWIQF